MAVHARKDLLQILEETQFRDRLDNCRSYNDIKLLVLRAGLPHRIIYQEATRSGEVRLLDPNNGWTARFTFTLNKGSNQHETV